MTIIQGDTGWIIVDTLTSKETAEAALKFARQHLGEQKISAIIFTHSHIDHFGGALGVLSSEEINARKLQLLRQKALWKKRPVKM
jgi:alkyl sulfatase BDS1-like metallo-beta-lactamase superfamily hydrolase